MNTMKCPQCDGPHTLSQCPNWRMKNALIAAIHREESPGISANLTERLNAVNAGSHRLLPVALAPHIRDALVETGKCFMPETLWAAVIAAHDLAAPAAQSQASAAPTDAQCKLALDLANTETDAWADGLDYSPKQAQIDGFMVRALLRHLGMASAAPVLTDAEDTARLDFLIADDCSVEVLTLPSGTRYRLNWCDSAQVDWHHSAREAIDAARHLAATPAKTEG